MISEIGSFIQQGVLASHELASPRGAALPWPYRSVVEWWPDLVSSDIEARLLESFVRRSGEPALEVGFGMGRRLADCRAAGADIDGLEPSLCPHTGTPVVGGLSFPEATALLRLLVQSGRRVVGFDLSEVAPDPAGSEWDGNVGARVLYKLIGFALRSRG